jgi:hypothetical protein
MKGIFSIRDLSIAKAVLADAITMQGQVDQYGNPFVVQTNVDWANKVVKFFTTLYDKARSFVGHWCARIALAWQEMKEMVMHVAKQLQKKIAKFGGRVLPDGTVLLGDAGKVIPVVMRTHIKRYQFSR